jgi:hypothetical protein
LHALEWQAVLPVHHAPPPMHIQACDRQLRLVLACHHYIIWQCTEVSRCMLGVFYRYPMPVQWQPQGPATAFPTVLRAVVLSSKLPSPRGQKLCCEGGKSTHTHVRKASLFVLAEHWRLINVGGSPLNCCLQVL